MVLQYLFGFLFSIVWSLQNFIKEPFATFCLVKNVLEWLLVGEWLFYAPLLHCVSWLCVQKLAPFFRQAYLVKIWLASFPVCNILRLFHFVLSPHWTCPLIVDYTLQLATLYDNIAGIKNQGTNHNSHLYKEISLFLWGIHMFHRKKMVFLWDHFLLLSEWKLLSPDVL